MEDHFCLVREVRSVLRLAVGSGDEPSDGEWDRIRALLFRALRPFEDARRAVWEALSEWVDPPVVSPA
jgi:hypothetical protein